VPAIVEHWQEQCQALVESHGGLLNRYFANGFLAFLA
jgi:hypothetical protein